MLSQETKHKNQSDGAMTYSQLLERCLVGKRGGKTLLQRGCKPDWGKQCWGSNPGSANVLLGDSRQENSLSLGSSFVKMRELDWLISRLPPLLTLSDFEGLRMERLTWKQGRRWDRKEFTGSFK